VVLDLVGGGGYPVTAARGNGQVVEKKVPLTVQSPGEADEHELLEVLGPVGRPEGQALRQVGAGSGENRHFLGCLIRIVALVESFLQITDGNQIRACYGRLDVVAVRYQENLADRDAVKLAVVNDEPAATLDSLETAGRLGDEGRRSPSGIAAPELAPRHVLLDTFLDQLRILARKAVERHAHRRPFRDEMVAKATDTGPGRIR